MSIRELRFGEPDSLRGTGEDDASLAVKLLAHDLNNVLQIVVGNLHMLARRLGGDAKARRHLDLARKGLELGSALATRALEGPAAGTLDQHLLGRDLADFVDLMAAAAGPDISLSVRVDPGLRPMRGDIGELENVVLNLVLNARDAMRGVGSIEVSFDNDPQADQVVVTVRDDGPGISPEVLTRVFDSRFTTKAHADRHGFGLATVRAFAASVGATITIDSGPRGTAVALRIRALDATSDGRSGDGGSAADRCGNFRLNEGPSLVLVTEGDTQWTI